MYDKLYVTTTHVLLFIIKTYILSMMLVVLCLYAILWRLIRVWNIWYKFNASCWGIKLAITLGNLDSIWDAYLIPGTYLFPVFNSDDTSELHVPPTVKTLPISDNIQVHLILLLQVAYDLDLVLFTIATGDSASCPRLANTDYTWTLSVS